MTVAEPKIVFSSWTPWRERRELEIKIDEVRGGAYLFARFEEVPKAGTVPWPNLPQEIIYVGEAKDLNNRPLARHNRTARYHEMFQDWGNHNLYVSICRLYPTYTKKPPALRVFANYLECWILWEYTKKYGTPPAMHYKKERTLKKNSGAPHSPVTPRRHKKKKP